LGRGVAVVRVVRAKRRVERCILVIFLWSRFVGLYRVQMIIGCV
jgi:hypothetical protein